MFLRVDPSSAVPVYVQIVDQVKHAVASGLLEEGDRLPSIRELARELRINPNTVIRAYRELEAEKVIVSRRGQGSFVSRTAQVLTERSRKKMLAAKIDALLVEAYHLRLTDDQVLDIVRERILARKNDAGKES